MLSWLKERTIDLLLAVFAGICISVGGAVYFSCPNKIVGSFLFGLGLCTIIFFKLNLFTGKVGYIPANRPVFLLQLLLIWIGNFLGVFLGAWLQKLTRIGDALVASAKSVTAIKLEDSLASLFVLGIFCGMMMYIAVEGSRRVPAGSAVQLAIILLPVAVFILCGFEHCIADLYYFALAGFTSAAWLRIVVITVGNGLGSVLLHLAANLRKNA
ncbi:MAG: formate/nitrite transporter family protein [Clostridia bacterium]|nr:formate/nitrite transporter family protein [Clostridia bacterium]